MDPDMSEQISRADLFIYDSQVDVAYIGNTFTVTDRQAPGTSAPASTTPAPGSSSPSSSPSSPTDSEGSQSQSSDEGGWRCKDHWLTAGGFWANPETVPEGLFHRDPYKHHDGCHTDEDFDCIVCGVSDHGSLNFTRWTLWHECSDEGHLGSHYYMGYINDECLRERLERE